MENREDLKEGSNADAAEHEDIPSDFFDDFSKEDFMEGLSVIDSWDADDNSRRRIDTKTLDRVKDLRELIRDSNENDKDHCSYVQFDSRYKWKNSNIDSSPRSRPRPESVSRLNDYIKPGSRRDPIKTNEAIRKDKEVKVKEYLTKHLESSNELRPPGTELDDYYEDRSQVEKMTPLEDPHFHRSKSRDQFMEKSSYHQSRSREYIREPYPSKWRSKERVYQHQRYRRYSPVRHQWSPRRSPVHHRNNWHRSPQRKFKRSCSRFSPQRYSPHHRSPRYLHRSRSPPYHQQSYGSRHSQSSSPRRRDSFLYPQETSPSYAPNLLYQEQPTPEGGPVEYSYSVSGYSYPQGPPRQGYVGPSYEYGVQPEIPSAIPMPQPVPGPVLDPSTSHLNPSVAAVHNTIPVSMTPVPTLVPAPLQSLSPVIPGDVMDASKAEVKHFDALAQLVAEGKISKEDYLKLTPNKGVGNQLDPKTRVLVLTRCNQAIGKLDKLNLPNHLYMKNSLLGDLPSLTPKYCSPLKRQAAVEFEFTNSSRAKWQENKQLVDSIIATIGLDKIVSRPKKKAPRDMKDAAVQTTRSYCDVCEIRESTKCNDVGTSVDPHYFTSSVHTQVVEQDLFSSKSIFNPTGSAIDNSPISIAHLTPAQLVSQLAARAKTLKKSSDPAQNPHQFEWRNPPNNYDNRGNQYHNNYNYRY